jgi:hypothetical protein
VSKRFSRSTPTTPYILTEILPTSLAGTPALL